MKAPRATLAFLLGGFCWSSAATAEPDSPLLVPLRAEVSGPSSCHTKDYFLQEILRRTPRAALAEGGELGWTLRVVVEEQGSRYQAKLTILANEGLWMERELLAPTCNDALDALAVVVSVLVETAVEQIKQHPNTSETDSPSEGTHPPKTNVPLPYVAGGVWVPWLDDPQYFEQRGITPVATRYVRSLVVALELDNQIVSQPQFGLGIGIDISRWHPNLFNPSYSLSLGWVAGDMNRDIVSVEASRVSLRAAICPVELLRQRTLGVRPCLRIDGGYVYAHFTYEGGEVSNHSKRYYQLRTTPFVRFSWSPIAGAELRLDGGVDFELYRPEFRSEGISPAPNVIPETILVFKPNRQAVYAATSIAIDW